MSHLGLAALRAPGLPPRSAASAGDVRYCGARAERRGGASRKAPVGFAPAMPEGFAFAEALDLPVANADGERLPLFALDGKKMMRWNNK